MGLANMGQNVGQICSQRDKDLSNRLVSHSEGIIPASDYCHFFNLVLKEAQKVFHSTR